MDNGENLIKRRTESTFEVTITSNNDDTGSITIDWSSYEANDKVYKVYRSKDGVNYESISIDHRSVKNIKCLQIYPIEKAKTYFAEWMNEYGKEIIEVFHVSMDDFNRNPNEYLKEESTGKWKYDVIIFGTCDNNNNKDLDTNVIDPLTEYINSGRGVIFGHDTVYHKNFLKFASYVGIESVNYPGDTGSTEIIIAKTGLLTKYPYYLETGSRLQIPPTHTSNQEVIDLDNVNFYLQTNFLETRPNKSVYLTTKNNVAMIQTGHSDGKSNPVEQQILVNLIFYCNQLQLTKNMTDYGAIDEDAPTKPIVKGSNRIFYLSSQDMSTTYTYYVKSFSKDNTSEGSEIATSNIVSQTVKTGLKSFCYQYDNYASTEVSLDKCTETTETKIKSMYKVGFLHVAAVDVAGNISPTTHINLRYFITHVKKHRRTLLKYLFLFIGNTLFYKI